MLIALCLFVFIAVVLLNTIFMIWILKPREMISEDFLKSFNAELVHVSR